MSTCLITGGAGNLACQLSCRFSSQFQRIVLFDVAATPVGRVATNAVFERGDLLDPKTIDAIFERFQPGTVIHLASLLSGSCEKDRLRGCQVNINGSFVLFETALRHNRPTVLFASSIASFGGSLPEVLTEETPQWPDSLYGVTKMAVERLGVYYQRRHGLDFRCLRLPITVSRHAPSGAASALASHAFIETVRDGRYIFRSRPETKLALIYVKDVLNAFAGLLAAPVSHLTRRVFNISAMTVTAEEIAIAIQLRLPRAALQFEPDEAISTLLASWPGEIDDQAARREWHWLPDFDLERTADDFLFELQKEYPG